MAGGAGMGGRQPEVEGQQPRLEGETKGRQHQDPDILGTQGAWRQRRPRETPQPLCQQDHRGGDGQGARVRADEVDPAGPADLGAVMLRVHQEEGRDGHDLPGHQEEQAVPRHEQQRHRRDQKPEKEPQGTAEALAEGDGPVFRPVDDAQARHEVQRQQKGRREGIQLQARGPLPEVEIQVGRHPAQQGVGSRKEGDEGAQRTQQGTEAALIQRGDQG